VCHTHDSDDDPATNDGFMYPSVLTDSINPSVGPTYDFGTDICGSLTFSNTGGASEITITYTQQLPSTGGQGLPRQYKFSTDGGVFSATLVLCYDDAELSIGDIDTEGNLRAYRYQEGTGWEELPHQSVDTTNNTITIEGVTQFSAWGIGESDKAPTAISVHTIATQNTAWIILSLICITGLGFFLYRRKTHT
jgi:hypothetical protein